MNNSELQKTNVAERLVWCQEASAGKGHEMVIESGHHTRLLSFTLQNFSIDRTPFKTRVPNNTLLITGTTHQSSTIKPLNKIAYTNKRNI